MRLAMLSGHLHGPSTGDWKFEQRDADAKQLQSYDGGSDSGEKRSCCSSQNLEVRENGLWRLVCVICAFFKY